MLIYIYNYKSIWFGWIVHRFTIPNIQTNRVSGNHSATFLRSFYECEGQPICLCFPVWIVADSKTFRFRPLLSDFVPWIVRILVLKWADLHIGQWWSILVARVMDIMPRPLLTWWTCSFEMYPRIDDVYVWTFGANECASATRGALRLLCASLSHCFPFFFPLSGACRMPSQTAIGCAVVTLDIFRL